MAKVSRPKLTPARSRQLNIGSPTSARPTFLSEDEYVIGRAQLSYSGDGPQLSVRRTKVTSRNPEISLTWGGTESCVARLNLIDIPANEIRQNGHAILLPPRRAFETSMRFVHDPCAWNMSHPIDQITFELPIHAVARWAERHSMGRNALQDSVSGSAVADPVLELFGMAVLPALERSGPTNQFFIDHVLDGVCAHVFRTFASTKTITRGGLAPWQERRAKEMMDSNDIKNLSMSAIASACNLSLTYFSQAFRRTCGTTPYQWLITRRLERAKSLLRDTDIPLTEIASVCGFSDQSHLTNSFSKRFGVPPGVMRREWKAIRAAG